MSDQVLEKRADALLALHQPGNPVVLPTVWDAWSARLAVDAGFAALTVGSHPLADSVGKADQEGMTFDDVLTRVKQITAAVDAPISVDIESGYGEAPRTNVVLAPPKPNEFERAGPGRTVRGGPWTTSRLMSGSRVRRPETGGTRHFATEARATTASTAPDPAIM